MAQPTGVRFKADKRRELAIKAAALSEKNYFKTRTGKPNYTRIAVELDISEPTARNLVAFGFRIRNEVAVAAS